MPRTTYDELIYDYAVDIIKGIVPDFRADVTWKYVGGDIDLHQLPANGEDDSRYFQVAMGPDAGMGGTTLGNFSGAMWMHAYSPLAVRVRYSIPTGGGSGDAYRTYIIMQATDEKQLIHQLTPSVHLANKWRYTNVIDMRPTGGSFIDKSKIEQFPFQRIMVVPMAFNLNIGVQVI